LNINLDGELSMKLQVLILGYGEMGHALEYLLAERHEVSIWSLGSNTILEEETTKAQVILFCLPANAHHEITRRIEPHLAEGSLCLSIAKGLDESGLTASQVFASVLSDQHRYGVIYGPMISEQIRMDRYSFADVTLSDADDFETICSLFQGTSLICRQIEDMPGSSWSVILKNVYAIMFGVSDELQLGDNMRGHLMVAALTELSAIVSAFGGETHTPYGYAGLGDLLTTATSENSHHHELGRKLASGRFDDISGEGVHTLQMVAKFHLFDTKAYPLFTLVNDIVTKPESLKNKVDGYLLQLRVW
jgi:glycerol-3-phosphate dehydrogenase (NAD(P)+)